MWETCPEFLRHSARPRPKPATSWWQKCTFWFFPVRCTHKSGYVINFIIVACGIYSRLKWYKNYKNRLRLAKVIVKNKMSRFFMVPCVLIYLLTYLLVCVCVKEHMDDELQCKECITWISAVWLVFVAALFVCPSLKETSRQCLGYSHCLWSMWKKIMRTILCYIMYCSQSVSYTHLTLPTNREV